MISGKEFAEKNFSQIEETKEKLFSTGNEELDNLLTEVYYSGIEDGYDYAQKEFAEKMSRKDRKTLKRKLKEAGLSKEDRVRISAMAKKDKGVLRDLIKMNNGDKEAKERVLEHDKKIYRKGGTVTGGITGASYGAMIGAGGKGGAKGALIGAGVGLAAGAGGGYLLGRHVGKKVEEQSDHFNDPRYKSENDAESDKARVALGKMTPEEFKKKWGRGVSGYKD